MSDEYIFVDSPLEPKDDVIPKRKTRHSPKGRHYSKKTAVLQNIVKVGTATAVAVGLFLSDGTNSQVTNVPDVYSSNLEARQDESFARGYHGELNDSSFLEKQWNNAKQYLEHLDISAEEVLSNAGEVILAFSENPSNDWGLDVGDIAELDTESDTEPDEA